MIAEAAIASFLSPDADERREAAVVKRLDRIDRNLQRLERDLENATVSLPESEQVIARATGAQRYERFVEALGRRFASGPKLRDEISDHTAPREAPPMQSE